jgi:hypothetical protein
MRCLGIGAFPLLLFGGIEGSGSLTSDKNGESCVAGLAAHSNSVMPISVAVSEADKDMGGCRLPVLSIDRESRLCRAL